jgi:hypothetical protein
LQLGKDLGLVVFGVLGPIFSGFTALLWSVIAAKTVYLAYGGSIFHAPCLDAQWPNRPTEDTEITQLPKPQEGNNAYWEGNGNST